MREIVQNLNQCESKDADPTIELRGHQVDPAKIERWQRRNGRVKDVVTPFISRPFEGKSSLQSDIPTCLV
jgi:hypothetical protein